MNSNKQDYRFGLSNPNTGERCTHEINIDSEDIESILFITSNHQIIIYNYFDVLVIIN